jgi:DMSO/TMAO reductase YedYZ molybdopterin-dependent catalytic subunit
MRFLFISVLLFSIMFLASCTAKTVNQEVKKPMTKLAKLGTPIFWAEGHPGSLDREKWQIEVTGLCKSPKAFSWNDLQKLPHSIADGRLTSVTRWSVRGNWGGVRVSDILRAVEADSTVKYIRFWSFGMKYDTSIPVLTAEMPKTLLAWEFDGEYLSEDYGGPVRVFCPYLWGYKSAKSVIKIELMDHYVPGYWEKRGYTDSGKIEAGPVRDINEDGKLKQMPDGEVIQFK